MLSSRKFKAIARLAINSRRFSSVKAVNLNSMDLSEHIARYKSNIPAENLMNLQSLPELGNPLNFIGEEDELDVGWERTIKTVYEFLGPEQVSPHYENFGMSRKVFLTFVGVSTLASFLRIPGDINYALDTVAGPFMFFFGLFYIFMEGRKSTLLPLLNRFYSNAHFNEQLSIMSNYQEDMYAKFRAREAFAREQLEYFDLHKEFKAIKNEAVHKLLVAEETYMKQHLKDRTLTLLESAKQMELQNKKKVTTEVLSNIKRQMRELKQSPSQEIKDDSFARALEGIRNGKIDYGQDLVLQNLLNLTRGEIAKINGLSEAEKDKMLCLTETQLQSLKSADDLAQKEFLKKKPVGLEGAFKEHEGFARTMAQW